MDPQELVTQIEGLMLQQKANYDAAMKQLEEKHFIDPEIKSKQEKLEQDASKAIQMATELKTAVNTLEERAGRPNAKAQGRQTLGKMFTESEQYKSATFGGHFRITATLPMSIVERKAASGTITEANYPAGVISQTIPGVSFPAAQPLLIRNLLTVTATNAGAIEYVQETWTNNADYQVAEGDKKAQSQVDYVDKTATVKTIAHFIKVSRQAAADIPQVMTSVDNRLRYGVLLKEDKELLYGSGAAGHLSGLMTNATAATGTLPTGGTAIDAILMAILQLNASGYVPTNVVLSAAGWGGIMSLKNSQGSYLYSGPPVGMAAPSIWGVPVTPSLSMNATDFLVGSFPMNAELFDRESVTVDIAYENEDDFVRNLITVRAEERIMLAVYAPLAFIKGTLTLPTGFEFQTPSQVEGGNGKTLESGQSSGTHVGTQHKAKA
jgi:HK97 family phage major capsid protein